MDKEKCEECKNYVKYYYMHPVLGLRKVFCGHCKIFKDNKIKKMENCINFIKDKNYNFSENYFTILIKIKMQIEKLTAEIIELEKSVKK